MLLADLQCWFTVNPAKNKEKNKPQSFTVTLSPLPSYQSFMIDQDHLYGLPMGWEKTASRSKPHKTASFWQ